MLFIKEKNEVSFIHGKNVNLISSAAKNQSLKNLIYTNYGERLYQPNIGSNIFKSMFELDDMFIANDIKYHIQKTITDNEPRINLQDVRIDLDPDNNYVYITIVYNVINITEIQTLYVSLQRVR